MKTAYERPNKKLERRRGTFFRIGMLISLLITFVAFEWKTAVPPKELPDPITWDTIEVVWIPNTWRREEAKLPQPKDLKKQLTPATASEVFIIVPDDGNDSESPVDSFVYSDIIPIDIVPEIIPEGADFVLGAEEMPEFPGKDEGLLRFLQNNTVYPGEARKSGIDGTVHLSFIVDESGNVTSIECLRSPSELLTEEAIRVLKKMPRWKPGIQSGKKVKVKLTLPFTFRLM